MQANGYDHAQEHQPADQVDPAHVVQAEHVDVSGAGVWLVIELAVGSLGDLPVCLDVAIRYELRQHTARRIRGEQNRLAQAGNRPSGRIGSHARPTHRPPRCG